MILIVLFVDSTGWYASMVILTLSSRLFYRRFNLHQIILAFIRKKGFGECLFQRSIAQCQDFPRLFSCLSSIFFIGSPPSLEASLCWKRFFSQNQSNGRYQDTQYHLFHVHRGWFPHEPM